MAKTYEQLQREIERLQALADKARRKEASEVIERIRQAIEHYGLTAEDLGLAPAKRRAAAKKRGRARAARKAGAKPVAEVRYRNEAGLTWVGRGKRPQWLRDALAAGHTLEEFKVTS